MDVLLNLSDSIKKPTLAAVLEKVLSSSAVITM